MMQNEIIIASIGRQHQAERRAEAQEANRLTTWLQARRANRAARTETKR